MEQKKLMQHTHKYIHNIATLANWLFFDGFGEKERVMERKTGNI